MEHCVTTRLGVNIDHVATLRQVRLGHEPEPVAAALMAQSAGAHGITVHLRADRRHVQDRDVRVLRDVLAIPLNVECAATPDAMESVIPIKPHWVTLVPETREELTTQGGLDVVFLQAHLRQIVRELHTSDMRVCLFIEPQMDQVKMASRLEVEAVELNSGNYANLPRGADPSSELERLRESSKLASRLGMKVLAGRGLNLANLPPIAALPEIEELNVGHSLIARAVLVGLERAVQEMLTVLREVRA
jgi:pyridoxine 5-phosphate synthase